MITLFWIFFSIQEGTTKLIYAFHEDDPSSEDNIPPHDFQSRGARSALLLNTIDNIPKLPDDTETFNFTANKVKLLRRNQADKCCFNGFEYHTSKHINKGIGFSVATRNISHCPCFYRDIETELEENEKCFGKRNCCRVFPLTFRCFYQAFRVREFLYLIEKRKCFFF